MIFVSLGLLAGFIGVPIANVFAFGFGDVEDLVFKLIFQVHGSQDNGLVAFRAYQ